MSRWLGAVVDSIQRALDPHDRQVVQVGLLVCNRSEVAVDIVGPGVVDLATRTDDDAMRRIACHGLAEATLIVTGADHHSEPDLGGPPTSANDSSARAPAVARPVTGYPASLEEDLAVTCCEISRSNLLW